MYELRRTRLFEVMEESPHNDKEQDFYIWKINGFYIGEEFF